MPSLNLCTKDELDKSTISLKCLSWWPVAENDLWCNDTKGTSAVDTEILFICMRVDAATSESVLSLPESQLAFSNL